MSLQDYENKLAARGLLEVCTFAQWDSRRHPEDKREGWAYPIYNLKGKPHSTTRLRWKAADGGHPKYWWLGGGKPTEAKYYYLPGLQDAIAKEYGVLHLASGEPDMLAFHAGGIQNTLTWLAGEKSIPENFVEDMKRLGVSLIYWYPDADETGYKAAYKLHQLLAKENGMALHVYSLPFEMGSKSDINDLWIASQFDAKQFQATLLDLPEIPESELGLYETLEKTIAGRPSLLAGETLKELLTGYFMSLGYKAKRNGWMNGPCVFSEHHTHGDDTASFGYNSASGYGKCFVCGTITPKELAARLGIEIPKVESHKSKPKTHNRQVENGNSVSDTGNPTAIFIDSATAYRKVADTLRGLRPVLGEPIEFPFKVIHQFGGFAHYMRPGKLILITGTSGGGKTSFGETIAEKVMRQGYDGVWFGPEWSDEEMAMRSLHRNRGNDAMSMDEIDGYLLEQARQAKGLQARDIAGQEKLAATIDRLEAMAEWPGRLHYIRKDREQTFTGMLDAIGDGIEALRNQGRDVRFLFWDYLDRTPGNGKRDFYFLESVSEELATFCENHNLIGFVFAQVNKDTRRAAKEGELLTENDARNLSDDQYRLYITLNPIYDGNGQATNRLILNIVKNNRGRKDVQVEIYSDMGRLAMLDMEVQKQEIDLTHYNGGH